VPQPDNVPVGGSRIRRELGTALPQFRWQCRQV